MFWLFLLSGCGKTDPTTNLPSDGFFSSTGTALSEWANCLAGFPGSPAQSTAAAWTTLAQDCPGEVYGTGVNAALELACAPAPAEVIALRGPAQIAFAAPRGETGMMTGSMSREGGGTTTTIFVPIPRGGGPFALVEPNSTGPGANVMTNEKAVLHARFRTANGIDIAGLVPEGTQGDKLFNLKSALLSRTVLAGTWEFAAYVAPPGQLVPQSALAVGVRAATAGPAIESFVANLRTQWQVQGSPVELGDWRGECIGGMKILPGLEPCWVLRGENLAIGWNQAALEHALLGPTAPLDLGDQSGAVVDFDQMAMADLVFAGNIEPGRAYPAIEYPLGRVGITTRVEGPNLVLTARSTRGCAR